MENENNCFLVFSNSGSLFAVTVQAVRETFALPEITPLEESPPCVVGVINLRGEIVPVMDLNLLFGRAPGKYRLSDCVIILDLNGERLGVIVNEAREVMIIPTADMDPAPFPDKGALPHPPFVAGEARVGEDIILLLDHERLMAHGGDFERPSGEREMGEEESESLGKLIKDPKQMEDFRRIDEIGNRYREHAKGYISLVKQGKRGEAVELIQKRASFNMVMELNKAYKRVSGEID